MAGRPGETSGRARPCRTVSGIACPDWLVRRLDGDPTGLIIVFSLAVAPHFTITQFFLSFCPFWFIFLVVSHEFSAYFVLLCIFSQF
jgi:hypothetical protein